MEAKMKQHILESWKLLVQVDHFMRRSQFHAVHQMVREEPLRMGACGCPFYESLCRAMDYACVFYFKRVYCLQRSAATALLLRRHGWKAEMVIGAQMLPFRSHAWCEIDGAVVNDKPYVADIYQVLERC
jgi:hypothetical protein